jgi:ABC-2 type transport system permease protein
MTAVPAVAPSSRPGTLDSLGVLYRLLLRTQLTIPRLLGIGALGALALLIGVFARSDADPAQGAADAVAGYGLGVLVPLATLWLGTSALGDLVEDRLLAYLRLKPVASWQLPAAAALATLTIVLPLTALPLTVAALIAGAGEVAPAAFLASAFAALAYAGLFVAAGLWFRRAVWWGLAFVVIWENVISHVAEGASRFTVSGWASAVLSLAPDVGVDREPGPPWAGLFVLTLIAVIGWLIATWRYRRADID